MSNWESELAELLLELSSSQTELLSVLAEKRAYMAATDAEGIARLEARERVLCDRLQACHEKRGALLQHSSLANWVLAQRTLLHLSQLVEAIATGGQLKPSFQRSD